jgi:dTDP-4-dehydrorhamnose reductase
VRVAVTGSTGRLGRALLEALEAAPFTGPLGPLGWDRSSFDLDRPDAFGALLRRDRPEVVVHSAAWTDVDGCAREPSLAMARNGEAVGSLARACVEQGIDLVVVSTNEVFPGTRTDGRGYGAGDPPDPPNPYGRSKLAGERAAADAYETTMGSRPGPYVPVDRLASGPQLAIVRTAWLYGPPGDDFPARIVAAAGRAQAAGAPLRVVGDEYGQPTRSGDLAEAIVELLGAPRFGGIHHCVNAGVVSRAGWARAVLEALAPDVPIEEIPAAAWRRDSTPPTWAVLEPTPLPSGEPMRPWTEALADDLVWRRSAGRSGLVGRAGR